MESGKYEDLIIMIKMKISTPLIAKTLAVRGFAASNYIAIQREQGTGNFLTGKTHV
jgi:hypothetical protein